MLSSNTLKIIAAFSMLIDHIGYFFFPEIVFFRIIGRFAFPIFAYMISEGCRYTKNKLRYFLTVFLLGAVCQAVYFYFEKRLYFGILITFSLSIALLFLFQDFKKALKNTSLKNLFLFPCATIFVWVLTLFFEIDYGFWGIMLPLFASISEESSPHGHNLNIASFLLGLVLVSISLGGIQNYSLYSIFLLLLYSGKRGKYNMKYFFYIFYPLHLLVLAGIKTGL